MAYETDAEAIEEARRRLESRVIPPGWNASVHRNGEFVSVDFDPPFVFLPANSHACYHVSVSLTTGSVSAFTRSNPDESVSVLKDSPCYVPSRRDRRKIRFVARAIRKQTNYDLLKEAPRDRMSIVEGDDHYLVDTTTPNTHYFYDVNKATGRLENEGHGHFLDPPDDRLEPVRDGEELDPEHFDMEMGPD